MTLFELFGSLGMLPGIGVGFWWGFEQGPLWLVPGAIFGALTGWCLGVFLAHGWILIDHSLSSRSKGWGGDLSSSSDEQPRL